MFLLKIVKPSSNSKSTTLELSSLGKTLAAQNFNFDFQVSAQDQEDIRWYLEDYLQNAFDPAPSIAARIEERISQIGKDLFERIFQENQGTKDLRSRIRGLLPKTRVEIATDVSTSALIPWELIRDPETDTPLALQAHSLVRVHSTEKDRTSVPGNEGPVRILLVISRPKGTEDVPYRSVATRLIKALAGNEDFQLDVLRPPTFDRLNQVLKAAHSEGHPYQVVHFDGHGVFGDARSPQTLTLSGGAPIGPRPGPHGYLLFETPKHIEGAEPIGGPELSALLREVGVPVLVLNACRSAHAESPPEPLKIKSDDGRTQTSTFGSLAQELVDGGILGVVAMRYRVYVVTASQFVAELYASLASGLSLGEAVTLGRRHLAASPLRNVAQKALPLQDWQVPVAYESVPIALRSQKQKRAAMATAQQRAAKKGDADSFPSPPTEAMFVGRDETILLLDRAFDDDNAVLLFGNAGAGKTSAAKEFARWYASTLGTSGPVLFTSFETYISPERLVDQTEEAFAAEIAKTGKSWLALTDDQRKKFMLDLMNQRPCLWIWDSVETIKGFPAETPSAWSPEEQEALLALLEKIGKTKAKVLLTSRRDEQLWLGDSITRIGIRPMAFEDCTEFAKEIASKSGRTLADIEDWRPLLKYTQGNPLTLACVIGQALRDGLKTKLQIEEFLSELKSGEAVLNEESEEGRSRSLFASLNYGFEYGFTEDEQKVLAPLFLFQGYVNGHLYTTMGKAPKPWHLAEFDSFSISDVASILERAAELGLLTSRGGAHFEIHPALPWFLKTIHEKYYGPASSSSSGTGPTRSERAFVEVLSNLGMHFLEFYERGGRSVIQSLRDEELNLRNAYHLAQMHRWWNLVPGLLQGLFGLYQNTARYAEWSRLLSEVSPQFIDATTNRPLENREEYWSLIMDYHVRLAMEAQDWPKAERLARTVLESDQRLANPIIKPKARQIKPDEQIFVRNLATSLGRVGDILRDQRKPECIAYYEQAIELYRRINDRNSEAARAFNLGHTYKNLASIRNLNKAETWYKKSLSLRLDSDHLARAQCLGQLGSIELERVEEAVGQARQRPAEVAAKYYEQSLELLPDYAKADIGIVHAQLGVAYAHFVDTHNRALDHWYKAIKIAEEIGDVERAAGIRNNVVSILYHRQQYSDARDYVQSALTSLDRVGIAAPRLRQSLNSILNRIERALQRGD